MYKYAAQHKLRFMSARGLLTVEQLFDVPLLNNNGFNLDAIARGINSSLKATSEESFVLSTTESETAKELRISLDIVKDVIATKQAAIAAHEAKKKKAEERRKILDLINTKKDEQLSTASIEDLEKKLAALDD